MSVSGNENQETGKGLFSSSRREKEEPVQLLLTAIDTGISLVRVEFETDLDGDESILSSFLTAFKYIGDLVFLQPFDRMVFGQYTMLMRIEFPFLFCYVFRGSINQATLRLREFIRVLQEETPLLNSLKTTIASGVVDKAANASIKDIATRFFTCCR